METCDAVIIGAAIFNAGILCYMLGYNQNTEKQELEEWLVKNNYAYYKSDSTQKESDKILTMFTIQERIDRNKKL